ncbi:MAG: hypothetical protein EZS28_031807 [Streblomastix strix]|uniref:Protein kinase domain-containing protein n=1 Tax=Streblomastix strix TaxID=222440 RepID=A0A5J4UQI1_9EUKA|nr:MAG: hypothetical protein EZS28_031807 [Streblomastix strix]
MAGFKRYMIFLVHNVQTGLVAAKVMESADFDNERWNKIGILQEGEPIPFVVKYIAQKQVEQREIILMDFANMESLDCIIERNQDLSPGTLRAIAKQLFEGLRLMHSKGFVHGNIRSKNVFLHNPHGSNRVIVKIAGFDMVKPEKRQYREMKSKAGIVSLERQLSKAPEQVIRDGKVDAKTDIWSAGVVLFQLVGFEYLIKATTVPELQTRFTAEQALQHHYFTGPQVQLEISTEAKQVASSALQAQQNGDAI